MVSRAFKLRVRRRFRMRKRQVEAFGSQAEENLERNLFRRFERLRSVRRFVTGWLLLAVLLIGCMVVQMRALGGYYQTLQPVPGGRISEGIVGSFTTANPVYATSSVDLAVSRLLFAGLYTYDNKNQMVGDLAAGPIEINSSNTVYTVRLKPDLKWQDGKPLTSADVVFTYNIIQNPDAKSPLNASWQGIKVAAPDSRTVTFTLPSPLAAFPYSLTNGIIPQHILGDTPMNMFRTVPFNTTNPVGSGPFKWQAIEVVGGSPQDRQERIALQRSDSYHAGAPKLANFVVHTFRTQPDMIKSFEARELNAMAGLSELPDNLKDDDSVHAYGLPLTAAVMTFFKTSSGVLADAKVRQALVQGVNTGAIIDKLGYPAKPVVEPLLMGQIGYDPAFAQAGYNPEAAKASLDALGWKTGNDGYRYKDKLPLSFALSAEDTAEYSKVARELKDYWKAIGVKVEVQLKDPSDFQSTLAFHSYDALLYGISIGTDPDVYAYWESSQANMLSNNRLNFSEYQSSAADSALDAGRTRTEPALRAAKYRPFLQSWQNDAPALGLYQPRFLYVTRGQLFNLKEHYINTPADRYNNVHEWMIRQAAVSQSEAE